MLDNLNGIAIFPGVLINNNYHYFW